MKDINEENENFKYFLEILQVLLIAYYNMVRIAFSQNLGDDSCEVRKLQVFY